VLFAHGSGSSRLSPRNVAVANALNGAGLGTLLFDLLTDHEADVRATVFDIELLAERLLAATDWLGDQPYAHDRKLGFFGASTGAAAALVAAAKRPEIVSAVVSRGGRPDLAGGWLDRVEAPTLLIVGGHDYPVIDMNREAARRLRCTHLVEIVNGATHLFDEAGALAQVSRLAQTWFLQYLR
jgi:dienelactone hydrolase